MNDLSDQQLLRQYCQERSQAAFAELVRRRVDLVYSAALRMVRDPHLAQDVSQGVFVALAQNARRLANRPVLSGWLHRTAQNLAAKTVRSDVRRRLREQKAATMHELLSAAADPWEHLAPQLDAALGDLNPRDRDAILMRYFERKSARAMAQTLGTTEEAAQKRVNRALERLRARLAKRGMAVGASAVGAMIAAHGVEAAPVGLAATLSSAALAHLATGGSGLTFSHFMTTTKTKIAFSVVIMMAIAFMAGLHQWGGSDSSSSNAAPSPSLNGARAAGAAGPDRNVTTAFFQARKPGDASPAPAEKIVADKLRLFGHSRREMAHALARRYGVGVPTDVELFFDAVEGGKWDEIKARFDAIKGHDGSASHGDGRPPGVNELWSAIVDAYGVAEQTHLWPAQSLLDYGNSVLGSLKPDMVYVGGTDNGRWIPELLNDTAEGDQHVIITQNGLADGKYLDYISELYGDRLANVTSDELQQISQTYLADAQKRLQHDAQFPDEPKQVQPGEHFAVVDGQPQAQELSQTSVMLINQMVLQALLDKNPGLSFGLQESFPLTATYAQAVPMGPLMELRAPDAQTSFTADAAAQSLDYWRNTAQGVLSDPDAAASTPALKSYSKDATSAANLLAAHNFTSEAEQEYVLASQICPGNPEAVAGLAAIYVNTGRAAQAQQLQDDFARNNPDQSSAFQTILQSHFASARR